MFGEQYPKSMCVSVLIHEEIIHLTNANGKLSIPCIQNGTSVADHGFPRWGTKRQGEGANLLFGQMLPNTT